MGVRSRIGPRLDLDALGGELRERVQRLDGALHDLAGGLGAPDDFDPDKEIELPSGVTIKVNQLTVKTENIADKFLKENGVVINRPPRDGRMAFIRSPDNISIELLQAREPLAIEKPWNEMENIGHW